ncbi:hypothetical protein ACVWXO_010515 [Bradyrhizobium sp. LM2.7]
MRLIILTISTLVPIVAATAQPLSPGDIEKRQLATMRSDVGRLFRGAKPDNEGLELCPSVYGRFSECELVSLASFKVTGLVLGNKTDGIYLAKFYKIRTSAGLVGYISFRRRDRFVDLNSPSRSNMR